MKNTKSVWLGAVLASAFILAKPTLALDVTTLTTRGDQSILLEQQQLEKQLGNTVDNSTIAIHVNPNEVFQTVDGMGFSLTEASAAEILKLPEAQQEMLLNEIYNPTHGNNTSIVRIAIGASDLSTELYTFSEQTRSGEHFTPDPSKTYYIDNPSHDVRIGATGVDEQPYTAINSPSGEDFEWAFVPAGDGLYFLDRAAGGPKPRLRTDDTNLADMQETSSNGWWEKWQLSPGEGHGSYFLSLPLKGFGNHDRLQVDGDQLVRMVDNDQSAGTWESFTFTEVGSDTSFSLQGPETDHRIPVLKKILAINPDVKILATPWTAPLWMKTNNDWVGGRLKPEHYASLADYFVNYIQAMKQEGIDIWAITVQNEPENPWNEPSMLMDAEEQFELVDQHVGPALQQAGFGGVKILAFDHNLDNLEFPIRVAQSQFVDGSAFHLYAGEIADMTTVFNATGKDVYFTEMWTGRPEEDTPEAWAASFDLDFWVHLEWVVMGSLRNHSRSVLEWNLVTTPPTTPTGCTLCLGAITINDNDNIQRNVMNYNVAQLSRFMQPGAQRIGSSEFDGDIINVALRNPDGSIVVLVYNKSINQNHTVSIVTQGESFEHTMTPRTAVTFHWFPEFVEPDTDGDGVIDREDQCPDTEAGVEVDSVGCPLLGDDDNDGIENSQDQCPQTPIGAPVDGEGCSLLDDDSDGVRNPFDLCPSTEAGVEVDSDGCRKPGEGALHCAASIVQDWGQGGEVSVVVSNTGETVLDDWTVVLSFTSEVTVVDGWNAVLTGDNPFTATPGQWNASIGAGASVDFGFQVNATQGVGTVNCSVDSTAPTDSDGDGVPDSIDQCPNTEVGTAVDANGCKVDKIECSAVTLYPNWLHADYAGGPNTHLLAGDNMVFEGQLYRANWYTKSEPGSDASWSLIGQCL